MCAHAAQEISERAILPLFKNNEHPVACDAPGTELIPKKSKFSEGTRQKMRVFLAAYAEGYNARYKSNPEGIRDKAVIGKLGHWIEHVPEVRAVDLVKVYLQISYKPFDENYHDLWQFFRHMNRIGVALDTGTDAQATNWTEVFRSVP